jgi:hypothetical protein
VTTREVNAERADQPSDAHHLRFAQSRALELKVSDEFTVSLCRTHHRELHRRGNEIAWWESVVLKPLEVAQRLWRETRFGAESRLATWQPPSVSY